MYLKMAQAHVQQSYIPVKHPFPMETPPRATGLIYFGMLPLLATVIGSIPLVPSSSYCSE